MLRYAAPIALIVLSACGGSSATTPVTVPVPTTVTDTRISSGAEDAPASTLTQKAAATTPDTQTPTNTANTSFGSMLNGVRATAGAGDVAFDARLGNAAQAYAETMLRENRFSHRGSDGSTVGSRATAAGYQWRTIGENIAQGYTSQQGVLDGWQSSPGHRANNENRSFEDFGLGVAGSGSQTRWVLILAAER